MKIARSQKLSQSIKKIISSLKFNKKNAEISLAVIDLNKKKTIIGGYNMDKFIYPASLYKIFIAAEVLRQADLNKKIKINSKNVIDKKKEILSDSRPLLKKGNKVTVEYLLNLMITRSDNTAANCLIDLVGRENINKYIIQKYHWRGSEVTRKFLPRKLEEKKYKDAMPTLTCARHVTEFLFLLNFNKLISKTVSQTLKNYMILSKHAMNENFDRNLSKNTLFFRKGGWFETKNNKNQFLKYNSDAGIVESKNSKYIFACLTFLKTEEKNINFPMKDLSKKIYRLIM